MPSLFSSRRRGNSALPPVDRSTSSAANAAATQAFIAKSQSMTNLSSAAAAAALRSLTTTPEPVGNIQTKRMVRRGSVSSINSGTFSTRGGAAASSRQAVGRTNSMTERTFRTPSPGGRSGAASPAYDPHAPPVPAIPRAVATSHMRSSSVEAPPRVVSPSPDSGGRAMSMDRRSMQVTGAAKKPPRLSNVAEEQDAAGERRNSVNFSRPMSPPASPTTAGPPKKYTHGTGSWYSGASGGLASKGAYQQSNTTKKVSTSAASQVRQAGPETIMVFDPNTRTFVAQPKAAPAQPPSPTDAKSAAPRWDASTRTVIPAAAAAGGGLGGLIGTAVAAPKPQQTAADPKLDPPPRNPMRVSSPTGEVPKAPRTMSLQTGGVSSQQYVAHRKASLDIPDGAGRGRNPSLSPQRSAHFSPSPIIEAQRHEPPGRSISPVKSAMKHSPASSIRTTSPLPPSALSNKVAPSDISDTTSLYSQDGLSVKGKKSARVSFDEKAQEINAASSASPTKITAREEDDTDDEIMRPRPALPSFGSVRRNRAASPEIAEKVTEMPPERHDVSSDHALGGILANAHAESSPVEPTASDEPFEPSITSAPAKLPSETPVDHDSTAHTEEAKPAEQPNVPGIALLPPTPVLDDDQKQLSLQEEDDEASVDKRLSKDSMSGIAVPGGWSDSASKTASFTTPVQVVPTTELGAIDEDSDPEFSDAAEDLDDNGGYASLNAIANSPVATTSDNKVAITTPDLPTAARESDDKTRGTGDWTEATAYWSQLSKAQREQIEREHMSSDDEARPETEKKPRKKKSAMKPGTETVASAQPLKPALKKTMRADPSPPSYDAAVKSDDGVVHLRRSMRDGPMASQTMRKGTTERQRPQSTPVPPRASDVVKPANNRLSQAAPPTSTAKTDVYSSKLKSKYTNDSDSESSFKKKRRQGGSSLDTQGRYSMKRSMRAGAADQVQERRPSSPDRVPKGAGRTFSLRSLSPSGSLFNRKRPEEIRQSLRSGGSTSDNNLRTSMRGPPAQKARAAPAARPQGRFKSRFADSDDEDEDDAPFKSFFSSRFRDSDDDSDPGSPTVIAADLRPVRGIPRRRGQPDGDSTDLEDEDEAPGKKTGRNKHPLVPDPADFDKAMAAARKKLGIPEAPAANGAAQQGSALNHGSLRKPAEDPPEPKSRPEDIHFGVDRKKKGLMGSILRRNRNSTQSVPTMGSMAVEPAPPLPTARLADTAAKPSTPTTTSPSTAPLGPGASSPSGMSKFLRRGRAKRTLSNVSVATAPPNTTAAPPVPDIKQSEHWPLPAPTDATISGGFADDERPNTSDGVSETQSAMRTGANHRAKSVRIAGVDGEIEDRYAVYSNRTGRKKKFGKLRRAFGLND